MITNGNYPVLLNGSFSVEDWGILVHALKTYVIREEEALKTQNVGDREWDQINRYKDIIGHIELYILPCGGTNAR